MRDGKELKPCLSGRGVTKVFGFGDAKTGLFVCTGDGCLEILELQAPGAKRMDAKTYLRGKPLAGTILS